MGARRRHITAAVLAATTAAVVAACGSSSGGSTTAGSGGGGSSGAPVKVGLVYSKTGLLSEYGAEYAAGFKVGLDYATHGTGTAAGHRIEVTEKDDAGDPAKAVAAFKSLVGDGYKIIAGTTDSGIALQLAPLAEQNKVLYISGPAAADAITGANKYTFRSGRQTYQDVKTAASFLGNAQGKHVLVFAQDSAFGQANAAAVKAVLTPSGATVDSLLVPLNATDFTPFVQKVKQRKPDLLFVAWAGTTTQALTTAFLQQGAFDATTVTTGLANTATYDAYGPAAAKIDFLSYYFAQAPKNPVNDYLVQHLQSSGGKADLFSPDGFVAAQMIVHAIESGSATDADKMVSALDGWSFDAPKGKETVRAGDHAMIQPMFQAKLVQSGGHWAPKLVRTVDADQVAPPTK
jgi:branched-chain amino acid transport system substrate-binding protein